MHLVALIAKWLHLQMLKKNVRTRQSKTLEKPWPFLSPSEGLVVKSTFNLIKSSFGILSIPTLHPQKNGKSCKLLEE